MRAATKIAFIGGGNMASGLLGGLLNAGWRAGDLSAADPNREQRRALTRRFGIECFADNAQCVARAGAPGGAKSRAAENDAATNSVVVLAVKPQFLRQAIASMAAVLQKHQPLLLSIVAGIRAESVLNWAGGPLALVRAMPNTPALINAGISGLFACQRVTQPQRDLAQAILMAVGETVWVQREALLDVITGISGSGPAYFFKLMELLASSARENGLDQKTAHALAQATATGAAMLAQSMRDQRGLTPANLRRQVTSPGGTTEAALTAMENLGLDHAIQQGIAAAIGRAAAIAEQFGAEQTSADKPTPQPPDSL